MRTQRVVSFLLATIFIASTIGAVLLVFIQSNDASEADKVSTESTAKQEDNSTNANKMEGKMLDNFTPTTDRVGKLEFKDVVEGTGAEVTATSTITAHYTGALVATGVIFQSSKDSGQPFTSPLSNLIEGWKQGIPGMKAGGVRRLTIPAELAYGSAGSGNSIPPDSDLVFDIELISVN